MADGRTCSQALVVLNDFLFHLKCLLVYEQEQQLFFDFWSAMFTHRYFLQVSDMIQRTLGGLGRKVPGHFMNSPLTVETCVPNSLVFFHPACRQIWEDEQHISWEKMFFLIPSTTKGLKYLPTHTDIKDNSPRWVNYWGLKYFPTMVSKQNIYKGSQELIPDLPAHTFFYKLRVGPAGVLSMWRYMLQELEERKEDRAKRTRVESNHRKLSWPMHATSNGQVVLY